MSRFERRPTELKSDVVRMSVLPLPLANKPESFSGAIGQFSITREASPQTLTAGDPVTLKYSVRGEGSLETLALPKANWGDFKIYEPTSSFVPSDALGLQGVKAFEQVVIPEHSQIKEIPPIDFSYFDPRARQFQTMKLEAIPLQVKPSPASRGTAPSPGGTNTAIPAAEAPRDIVHIKSEPGRVLGTAQWYQNPAIWALQCLPVLAFVAAFAWRKREDKLANNPALRKQLELRKQFHKDLHDLQGLSALEDSTPFFTIAFRMLQTWLALKTGFQPGAITESAVDDLAARGLPPEKVAQLHQLFHICNQAKYAPESLGAQGGPVLAALENLGHDLEGPASIE